MLRFSEENNRFRLIAPAAARLLPVLCLLSLLLSSCATVPRSRPTTGWLAVLPDLGPECLYVSADVPSSWRLLQPLVAVPARETGELVRIVENLDRLHALIRLSPDVPPGQVPEFSLVVLGTLSPGCVACRLNLDSSWERVMLDPLPGGGFAGSRWSYRTYWRKDKLEIAAPARGVLFVSGGGDSGRDPAASNTAGARCGGAEALLRRLHSPKAQPLPAQVLGASENADIFLYIPDPLALASLRAASATSPPTAQDPGALLKKLPIHQGWISARRQASGPGFAQADGEDYELEVVFLLDEVENPRSVEMLLRLMLTLWLRKVQVEEPIQTVKAVTFRTDSESVRIESLVLGDREIASLLGVLFPGNLNSGGVR
jgi:hypothetical protein